MFEQDHRSRPVVAVIGAGAAGALTASALLRDPRLAGAAIRLVDSVESTGRGAAYGTTDPAHLLNVPVARMSADPDDPDGFLRWLQANKSRHAQVTDYVPRMWFGEYIEATLAQSARGSANSLYRITDSVFSIRRSGGRHRVRLHHGLSFLADAVVLAVGEPQSDLAWLPQNVTAHRRFCADPWQPQVRHRATDGARRVLVLGAGLSMIDIVLGLDDPDRRVIAISRSGLLPAVHAEQPPVTILPPPVLPDAPVTLGQAGALVADQVRRAQQELGDWRPGIDSLRPVTDELWRRLSLGDQRRFAFEARREWEVRRHRMPPEVASDVDRMRQESRLAILAGQVVDVRARGERFRVRLHDGRRFDVEAIINCTGAGIPERVQHAGNPLVADLIAHGTARLNAQGLGLDCDPDGRLVSAGGSADNALFAVGAYRRGPIWETTAIPQIRVQARRVAARVAEAITQRADVSDTLVSERSVPSSSRRPS